MINKDIAQFPIVYFGSSWAGRCGIGWGAHTTIGNECKAAGITKALIVSTGLRGTGIVDEIQGIIKHHGVSTEVFTKVTSNPKDHEVMAGYEVFKAAQCDGVVSVGGGSSHDCGKAIRVVATNNGTEVTKFNDPATERKPVTMPQIAVNTTSGTGAQATAVAAITDTKRRVKGGGIFRYPGVAPILALDDPLLVRMQPENIAAWTGFDAFAHAFEMYLSRISSHLSTVITREAIKLVFENLREFTYNRGNNVACENMVWATALSGTVGLGSGAGAAGIVHGLGHGLSAVADVHHGRANAVVTVPAERLNQVVYPDKFAEMAEAMGEDTFGLNKMQASEKWFEAVETLLKDLNIQTGNLNSQFGIKKEDCAHIIKNHYGGYMGMGNPRELKYEEILSLLESLI
jgi:alcohol dehydrogenase class IV